MGSALMQLDQVGLAAGVAGEARLDGLRTGAVVTLTSTDPGSKNRFELLDVGDGDTNAVSSLAPTGGGATPVWTFSATPGVHGPFRVRLIVDEGLPTEESQIRIFGIPALGTGLVYPALNEQGDPTASLVNNGPAVQANTERTVGGTIRGWQDFLRALHALVESGADATSGPIDLFVRDVDGDDNNPGTTGSPMKSIQAALDTLPFLIRHPVNIHVGAHGGVGYPMPIVGLHAYEEVLNIIGDGGGTGDGFTVTLAAEVAAAGTSEHTIISSTGGFSTDDKKGHAIDVLDGACAGYRRLVFSNDATDLKMVADTDQLGNVVAPGDTFRVVRPAVVIQMSAGVAVDASIQVAGGTSLGFGTAAGDPSGGLVFSQFAVTASQQQEFVISDVAVAFFGVEQDQTASGRVDWKFSGNSVYMGSSSGSGRTSAPSIGVGAPDTAAWSGWGHYRVDNGVQGFGGPLSSKLGKPPASIVGYIISNKRLECFGQDVQFSGGNIAEGMDIRGPSNVRIQGDAFVTHKPRLHATGSNATIRASDGVDLGTLGLDLDSDTGLIYEIFSAAHVLSFNCTGAPTAGNNAIRCYAGGEFDHVGALAIGHATNPDLVIDGVALGINKNDLVAAGDGILGVNGASISRRS